MESATVKKIDQIFSDMAQEYIIAREELREKHRQAGKTLLFVLEVCGCSEKPRMRLRFPEIEKAETYNAKFAVGQLVEEALKRRFRQERQRGKAQPLWPLFRSIRI